MDHNKSRRKNYFIDKKFQGIFILKFCLLMGLGLLVSAVILYLLSKSTVTTSFINSRLSIVNTADYIRPVLLWGGVSVFFAMALIGGLVFMFLTHRIAGAIFNIKRNLNNLANGDLTVRIKLRSTDHAREIADGINRIFESLRNKISDAKKTATDIEKEAEGLSSDINDNAIKLKLKSVVDKAKNLQNKLDYFQTEK